MRKINLLAKESILSEIRHEIETIGRPGAHGEAVPPASGGSKNRRRIVNVSSGLAFVPFPVAPIYCAAKAGLHSFTQSLRVQLRKKGQGV